MFNIPNTNFYIGNEQDLKQNISNKDIVKINLAGNLHSQILRYKPSNKDKNYIIFTKDNDTMSVNFVDASDPKYYNYQNNGTKVFGQILDFMDINKDKKVLVNCNHGQSRSPSLVLLYLAKRLNLLSKNSFEEAKKDFMQIYPNYSPALGIQLFLGQNWNYIL
jgi:protein-tyrosine phosphatase